MKEQKPQQYGSHYGYQIQQFHSADSENVVTTDPNSGIQVVRTPVTSSFDQMHRFTQNVTSPTRRYSLCS